MLLGKENSRKSCDWRCDGHSEERRHDHSHRRYTGNRSMVSSRSNIDRKPGSHHKIYSVWDWEDSWEVWNPSRGRYKPACHQASELCRLVQSSGHSKACILSATSRIYPEIKKAILSQYRCLRWRCLVIWNVKKTSLAIKLLLVGDGGMASQGCSMVFDREISCSTLNECTHKYTWR